MTELSLQARRLIRLASQQDEAAPGVLRRVEQSLAARIAAGVGVGLATATVAKSAVGAVFGVVAAKVGVVGTMIAATAGAGWLISTALSRTQEQGADSAEVAFRPQAAPRATSVDASKANAERIIPALEASTVSTLAPETALRVSPAETSPGRQRRSVARTEPSPSSAEEPANQLREETADLRLAQQALRSGRPAQALALLDQQDARYRSGVMAQERAAARILALCLGGQAAESRSRAERFEQKWPRSPLLARVQSSCRGQSKSR